MIQAIDRAEKSVRAYSPWAVCPSSRHMLPGPSLAVAGGWGDFFTESQWGEYRADCCRAMVGSGRRLWGECVCCVLLCCVQLKGCGEIYKGALTPTILHSNSPQILFLLPLIMLARMLQCSQYTQSPMCDTGRFSNLIIL